MIDRVEMSGIGSTTRLMSARSLPTLAAAAAILCGAATYAGAHGFGQRYDLPIPLSFYLFGAASAVALSFVVFGLFVRHPPGARGHPRRDLLAAPFGRLIAHPAVVLALKLLAVCLFAVTVLAGFTGDQNPYRNIAPTLVWIVWWVGFAYVSAFAGDLWAVINPWRTIYDGGAWLYRRATGRADPSWRLPYPEALGAWPACALLLTFSWIELVYPDPAVPAHIAWLAVAYSVVAWAGMLAFGRDPWLRHGEVFAVFFGTLARFAPAEIRVRTGLDERQLLLRPFGSGLLDSKAVSTSMMAFVLLMLATVLYDGLIGTPEWSKFESAVRAFLHTLGEGGSIVVKTIGLVAFWLVFLGAYLAVAAIMSALAMSRRSPLELARGFALTLVPIAVGYHVAHYLVFLLVQGQYVVPLVSDPFGYGWDLFGTAGYRVDIAIVGARFAWYAAVAAIVLGHVAAVYLAHVKAMRLIESRSAALRSQVPLTALMMVYTFIGLSITAEPIVERGTAAKPSAVASAAIDVPADAMLPVPRDGRLQAVGEGSVARQKLSYRVLGSAFHDATRVNAADLLYAYMFAYRWGVRGDTGDAHYDPYVEAATAPMRRHLVAVQVIGSDTGSKSFRVGDVNFVRELFSIDVYLSMTPETPEQDAAVAPPWSTLPWHLIVLMEEAVSRGWGAFSQAEARRRGLAWLDLARSEETGKKLAALLATFERDGYRPDSLRSLVSEEEARRRWAALAAFHKAHGHFLVTNGPYRLKQWSAQGVTLEAFRDLSYPLGVGSYDAYAIPRRGFVTEVERNDGRITLSGDIEMIEKFQRSYRLARTPMRSIAPEILKRSAPECRYVMLGENQHVALAGAVRVGEDAKCRIDAAGQLPAGRYILMSLIAVGGNVMNADIRRDLVAVAD
jgi:hypothetical protein